jgi:hypothetical protein
MKYFMNLQLSATFRIFFIYLTNAQLDCSKNVNIYIKMYMRGVATCFGFSQLPSGSYYMCFAKVKSINNQLKYVVINIV